MKVKDYIESGLKNFVEVAPSDYKEIGKFKSGSHVVSFYIKDEKEIEKVKDRLEIVKKVLNK